MCRFSSVNNSTYEIFVQSIKKILKGDEIELTNEYFEVPVKGNPNFTGRNDIRKMLNDSLIADRRLYSKIQQRYVLYGLGGSGKTQISLKFAHDNRNK